MIMEEYGFLTPQTLLYLGVYDETYSLYTRIQDIYDTAFDEKTKSKGYPYLTDAEYKKCGKQVIDLMNKWMDENRNLFPDEYKDVKFHCKYPLYLQNVYIDSKLGKNGKYLFKRRHIAFARFISSLEEFIVRNLDHISFRNGFLLPEPLLRPKMAEKIEKIVLEKMADTFIGRPMEDAMMPGDIGTCVLVKYRRLDLVSCSQKHHQVVPGVCCRELYDETGSVRIPVHHCMTCGKVYIGEKTLQEYQKEYGLFFIETTIDISERVNYDDYDSFYLKLGESKLHSLGYNVIDGEWSERERHDLLVYLLKKGYITYLEMSSDIENAISRFKNYERMQPAIKKWRSDLKYIGDYIVDQSQNE